MPVRGTPSECSKTNEDHKNDALFKSLELIRYYYCLRSVIGSTVVIPEVNRQSQALTEEFRFVITYCQKFGEASHGGGVTPYGYSIDLPSVSKTKATKASRAEALRDPELGVQKSPGREEGLFRGDKESYTLVQALLSIQYRILSTILQLIHHLSESSATKSASFHSSAQHKISFALDDESFFLRIHLRLFLGRMLNGQLEEILPLE